ncbi:hypothetical protein NM208_g8610 [Fusarium decemcellulare]|uniref:Uncharacterized protein n=1 Tax=Fusarium decemcellulare TaxID=57161 RepID=A0ACC1S4N1_9HYPO|nr:hypothetical protein NM208_g8610 [Fusarium decemcellulare]
MTAHHRVGDPNVNGTSNVAVYPALPQTSFVAAGWSLVVFAPAQTSNVTAHPEAQNARGPGFNPRPDPSLLLLICFFGLNGGDQSLQLLLFARAPLSTPAHVAPCLRPSSPSRVMRGAVISKGCVGTLDKENNNLRQGLKTSTAVAPFLQHSAHPRLTRTQSAPRVTLQYGDLSLHVLPAQTASRGAPEAASAPALPDILQEGSRPDQTRTGPHVRVGYAQSST